MAKIGPILSIIFPATSTDVHPAVLYGVPFEFLLYVYNYKYNLLDVLGVSNITIKTYFGLEMGKLMQMYLF